MQSLIFIMLKDLCGIARTQKRHCLCLCCLCRSVPREAGKSQHGSPQSLSTVTSTLPSKLVLYVACQPTPYCLASRDSQRADLPSLSCRQDEQRGLRGRKLDCVKSICSLNRKAAVCLPSVNLDWRDVRHIWISVGHHIYDIFQTFSLNYVLNW